MVKQATELRYAVRFRVVFKYFGQLCLVLAALTLVPLAMSVIFGDTAISLRYTMAIGGLAALWASLARLRAPSRVQANEGMVLVALMFFFTPLVMSYPMMGSGLGFLDAFFEAVSGVTTTGLSTKATLAGAQPAVGVAARAAAAKPMCTRQSPLQPGRRSGLVHDQLARGARKAERLLLQSMRRI